MVLNKIRGGPQEENSKKKNTKLGMQLGNYELGRTLGEGNFGKVKFAKKLDSGHAFAVKILEKKRIIDLKITDQIKREVATLKLLKHPNVVRLHENPSVHDVSLTKTIALILIQSIPLNHGLVHKSLLNEDCFTLINLHWFTWPGPVLASKSKIYMVLEYVTGGELFDRIASKGRLPEAEGRKLFQQLIDGVSYCHNKGVFHRDLKLENVLVDSKGNIKISDFGLSALPQHFRDDGLLHTTCGSPNYVAPEVLANRGYDGATSDIWSCGVILYVILIGYLPFDDRNLAVLYQKVTKCCLSSFLLLYGPVIEDIYMSRISLHVMCFVEKFQIFKGDAKIPKWLSPGAQNMLRRILEPNPIKRMTMADIKADEWFKQDYTPADPNDEDEDIFIDDEAFSMQEASWDTNKSPGLPTTINAFQLIGMSSCLDLSGFFEKEDVSERKIRFTSNLSGKDLLERIEDTVTEMGFRVRKRNGKLKATQEHKAQKSLGSLSVAAELFEISPSLFVVELRKSYGDTLAYRQLCKKLSSDLGDPPSQELFKLKATSRDLSLQAKNW
ncbi:hypothetical protein Pint_24179 [Pistacia integerrima]|uniref:Uncharacterized protein n=1 Tax=Pistacia integerrima TaxID=434235 RepID=A0ACC0YED6_9ROSI|nr:hypothetical protein Pint_24179 [Pistacia integerrima]